MENIAVLLLNLGGPESLKDIRPFLTNLFLDREIIRLPLQPLVARIIASSRAKKVAPRYETIGGSSPIRRLTQEQAKALEDTLNQDTGGGTRRFKVFCGMRYANPFIIDALNEIAHGDTRFDKLIVLPLFPQYSKTTTGSCFKVVKEDLEDEAKWHSERIDVKYIDEWYDDPLYLESMAEKINKGLNKFDRLKHDDIHVLFSAHSIPRQFVDEGDPYKDQVEQTVEKLLTLLEIKNWSIAYQSHSGPVEWLEPNTEDVLKDLAANGQKAILVVPVSFVSDHIETLYEIDIMYKDLCASLGVNRFERSPSLNSNPKFIQALAGIVKHALNA